MRIIRHSPTGGRITEFVKEDRARVNMKVNPSLQYSDGIELAASIDDTTTAIVYLRWDDLREIVQFIRKSGTVRQKEFPQIFTIGCRSPRQILAAHVPDGG